MLWFHRKEKAVFSFIKTFEERVAAKAESEAATIKNRVLEEENLAKQWITGKWDGYLKDMKGDVDAIGMKLDDEALAALKVLEDKLTAWKATIATDKQENTP